MVRGENFVRRAVHAKQVIAELGEQFIQDGNVRWRVAGVPGVHGRGSRALTPRACAGTHAWRCRAEDARWAQVVLVHSISRPVMRLLNAAAAANKRFTVYVTEARPTLSGCGPRARSDPAGVRGRRHVA